MLRSRAKRSQRAADEARVQQLERHLALEQAIGALGQPHRTHAALTEQAQHAVGAETAAFERGLGGPGAGDAARDEFSGFGPIRIVGDQAEQLGDQAAQIRLAQRQPSLPGHALRRLERHRLVEQGRDVAGFGRVEILDAHAAG